MARVSEIALLRELVEISELERFKSLDRIAGGVDLVACGAEMRHSPVAWMAWRARSGARFQGGRVQ